MKTTNRPGQRRAPRLLLERPGRLRGRAAHAVTVVDLSTTGCLVRCEGLLDPGAILDLDIDLEPPPADPFSAKVRVIEASLDGARAVPGSALAGLEFLGLPAREDARLRQYIERERRRRRADASPR